MAAAEPPITSSSFRLEAILHWLLAQGGGDCSTLELAEILWLAHRMPPAGTPSKRSTPREETPSKQTRETVHDGFPDYREEERSSETIPKPLDFSQDKQAVPFFPEPPPREPPKAEANLLPEEVLPNAADVTGSLHVRVAETPPLGDRFALIQALRPLMRRRPDPWRLQINETRTAELFAESRLLLPVMEPFLVPSFEVLILVDGGVSMQVWHKLAEELQTVLTSSQAFARVHLKYLELERVLSSGSGEAAHPLPSSCSLLLLLTDASGRHWWDDSMFTELEAWARAMPTVILQMLPIWWWERTSLGAADRVSVSNTHPAAPNPAYMASALNWLDELDAGGHLAVPVITPDRRDLATWSAMVMGDGSRATPGVLLANSEERKQRLESFLGSRDPAEAPSDPGDRAGADALWVQFQKQASPQAQRLLMVMAAAPVLTLPVIGLLKEAKVPEDTSPLPIAEVLVSGLVRRRSSQEHVIDPDRLQFEVLPAVADLLRERLNPGDTVDVIRAVSELVERRWNQLGTGHSFEAVLTDPSVLLPEGMEGMLHFATVTAALLENLPGEAYRRFAAQLRAGVGLDPPDPWPKEEFHFEVLEFETAQILWTPEVETFSFTSARFEEIDLESIAFATATIKRSQESNLAWKVTRSDSTTWAYHEPLTPPNTPASPSQSLTMLLIPAGSFLMGSPTEEPERFDDEGPQHEVTLAEFFLARTPITQAQWRAVAGWQPLEGEPAWELELKQDPLGTEGDPRFRGDDRPVVNVSWHDAMEFCRRLRLRTGKSYTLPSEAQWEYACRAGIHTPFHFGATISPELANYDATTSYAEGPTGEYRQQTTDVASFPANVWGLHDMHGNVWEWCLDQGHTNYEGAPADGSAWIDPDAEAATRLLRGGSWFDFPRLCRSACRNNYLPDDVNVSIGFRVCCLPQDQLLDP